VGANAAKGFGTAAVLFFRFLAEARVAGMVQEFKNTGGARDSEQGYQILIEM